MPATPLSSPSVLLMRSLNLSLAFLTKFPPILDRELPVEVCRVKLGNVEVEVEEEEAEFELAGDENNKLDEDVLCNEL